MARKIFQFEVEGYHNLEVVKFKSGKFAPACERCRGNGHIEAMAFHCEGVCFKCLGRGYQEKFFENEEAVKEFCKKKSVRMAKKRAKEEAEYAARLAEFEASREAREAEEQRVQAEREAEKAKFSYIEAQVGEIVEFSGEVKAVVRIDGHYGVSLMVVVQTEQNQQFKFFSTANWVWEVEVGEQVQVRAEVKDFSEYQGIKQNVVKNPKKIA
jgi:hypothetical protein